MAEPEKAFLESLHAELLLPRFASIIFSIWKPAVNQPLAPAALPVLGLSHLLLLLLLLLFLCLV
jgi:hypothetical protein